MRTILRIKEMSAFSRRVRLRKKRLGFVPTMGALHEGHLSLIRQARKQNDIVVVSIFVNPTQFSPSEDFKKYPRDFKRDAYLCRREKVDIIFYPDIREMYPREYRTYVTVEELSSVLCGKSRRGHFKGVATVVTKLFNIVSPDIAYFGQKDAQQAVIIQKMVSDLNIPVEIKVMPTIREKDGLALSSRNIYLSPKERKKALAISEALRYARCLIKNGKKDTAYIVKKMSSIIKKKQDTKIEYISIVDSDNLRLLKKIKDKALIALAVWVGKTRLIDNIIIKL